MKGLGGQGMVRPQPRPNPAMAAPAAPARPGLFPNMSAQKRYDMAMGLLQAGMSSASQSNNPLLAFLSPLAGAAIGGSIENKYAKAQDAELEGINDALLGTMAGDETAQGLLGILNNESAPDYARSMAKAKLEAMMKPKASGTAAPSRGRPPANTDALLATMFHTAMDPDSDGGDTITPREQARIDAVRASRARSSEVSHTYGNPLDDDAPSTGVNIDGYIIQQID